jgi:hypothetical protein
MEAAMVLMTWLGALLIVGGVLYMAGAAIFRGRLSDPHTTPAGVRTLEPPRRGLRFLGMGTNWPGVLLVGIGVILMFIGTFTS